MKIKNDASPTLFYFHGGSGGLDIGISLWVCGVWSGPALMLYKFGAEAQQKMMVPPAEDVQIRRRR